MIVAAVGLWGIRIPFSLLLTYYFHMDIIAIWIVMGVDLVIRFILSYIIYKTKNIYNRTLVFKEAAN
jgi:Na+-driven multidrug efflux pump